MPLHLTLRQRHDAISRVRNFTRSLKLRLTLGVVAVLVVGTGAVAGLLVWHAERDTVAAQRHRQMSETVRTAQVLARRAIDLQRALQVAAAKLDPATVGDRTRLAAFIGALPVLNSMFASIHVVLPSGRMEFLQQDGVVSFPGLDLLDRPHIRMTLQERRPLISSAFTSRLTGEPTIVFTYPLIRDGALYGVLSGSLRLSDRDLLADLVIDDASGSLLVVTDLDGLILAHPTPGDVSTPVARQPRLDEAFAAWVAAGSPAEPAGLSLPHRDQIVSLSGVPGTDWVVWRALPTAEVLAPFAAGRKGAMRLVIGWLAATSLVVFGLLAWLLRPLALLSVRAQHLFDGQHDPQEGWPRARGEIGHLAQVLRHVGSERAHLEVFNSQVLRKLSSVMSAAPIGIAFTRDAHFELVSAELCRMLGRAESELLGHPIEMIYPDRADYLATLEHMEPLFRDGRPYEGEWSLQRADGSVFPAQLRGRAVDGMAREFGIIWTVSDVTTHVASRELLEWSATHDVLTGLANRKLLEHRLGEVFAARVDRATSAVVVIDLDHFKVINDRAGHAAGDTVLKAVANAMTSKVRASDLVARTGGDEFALVLPGCSLEVAMRISDEILAAVRAIGVTWKGETLRVGASIGVAMLEPGTTSVDAWVAQADTSCYEVKRAGRDAVLASGGANLLPA